VKRGARDAFLATDGDLIFLPLVTSFVEQAALCFGLGRDGALGLTLASEEIFTTLCRSVMPSGGSVEIRCTSGGYYVQTDFSFAAEALDVRFFNLTTAVSLEEDSELEGMGLVIASRLVDRFRLSREKGHHVRLSLIQEKSYPPHGKDPPGACRALSEFSIRPPIAEEVKCIAQQARSCYDGQYLSDFFLYPGKMVDMIASGEYKALAAIGPGGEIGGAILWHWVGRQTIECFGPYIFSSDAKSTIPDSLVEHCIGAIARTQAIGLLNLRPTAHLPEHQFEKLGTLTVASADGSPMSFQAWFRLMREDAGCAVWVHESLKDFVSGECGRLVLPREIRSVQNVGESLPGHSVIAAEFDRLQSRVMLRPMWPGADCRENIARHVHLMRQEAIPNVFFLLDLGQAWQADFTPGLLRHGFKPRCLLPYAGEADVVLFQLSEALP
jgi:anti-sigma regulatory factor (Ser/Thr protein kinase)